MPAVPSIATPSYANPHGNVAASGGVANSASREKSPRGAATPTTTASSRSAATATAGYAAAHAAPPSSSRPTVSTGYTHSSTANRVASPFAYGGSKG